MKITSIVPLVFAGITVFLLAACEREALTPESDPGAIAMDADDIAGVVRSTAGVEAGVWVIAETEDLGTRFMRIVVTDDAGRYLVPDLPAANYWVWVRGYGLQDSSKVTASPGDKLDLTAIRAPDAAAAAQVYPVAYWFAMLGLPTEEELSDVPGGLNNYLTWTKNMGCVGCHQLGQLSTERFLKNSGISTIRNKPGRGVSHPARRATVCCASLRSNCRACQSNTWQSGLIGSLPANCPLMFLKGPPAWKGISSQP